MKISTKGRYALRMMVDLAEHQNGEYISLKDIAQRQEVSKKYLEQIVPILNKSGFLKTNRGYQGTSCKNCIKIRENCHTAVMNSLQSLASYGIIAIGEKSFTQTSSYLDLEVIPCPRRNP